MNLKEIQNLIRFVSKSDVTEVKYKNKEFEINIKTNSYTVAPNMVHQAAPITHSAPPLTSGVVMDTQEDAPKQNTGIDESKFITVKSPMIGTFYRKAGPDKPTLASEGDQVEEGKVLCIIEAMKLFNEIESEVSGKIVKVLVEDAMPVEFDQPLFLVDPS